jgi:hypothetical protein
LFEILFFKENYFQIKNENIIKNIFLKTDLKYNDYSKQIDRLIKIWIICFFVIVFDIFSVWLWIVKSIKNNNHIWLDLLPITILWFISLFHLILFVKSRRRLKDDIINIIIDIENKMIHKQKVLF